MVASGWAESRFPISLGICLFLWFFVLNSDVNSIHMKAFSCSESRESQATSSLHFLTSILVEKWLFPKIPRKVQNLLLKDRTAFNDQAFFPVSYAHPCKRQGLHQLCFSHLAQSRRARENQGLMLEERE